MKYRVVFVMHFLKQCRCYFRLAVFSATFSTTGGGHVFCPVSRGGHVPGIRHVSGATCDHSVTDAVSTLCHGYPDCSFPASPRTLGGNYM